MRYEGSKEEDILIQKLFNVLAFSKFSHEHTRTIDRPYEYVVKVSSRVVTLFVGGRMIYEIVALILTACLQ